MKLLGLLGLLLDRCDWAQDLYFGFLLQRFDVASHLLLGNDLVDALGFLLAAVFILFGRLAYFTDAVNAVALAWDSTPT